MTDDSPAQNRAVAALVVGLGSSRGVRPDAVWSTLRAAVPDLTEIVAFATVDRRRTEPGLLAVIEAHGAPLRCYSAAELDTVDVPNPSASVRGYVGTRSVAEAAALLAARDLGGGRLIVPKLRGEHVTVAVAALDPSPSRHSIRSRQNSLSRQEVLPGQNPVSIGSACTACGACLLTCPEHALRPAPHRPVVIASRCTACGECVEICPTDAITLRDERKHA